MRSPFLRVLNNFRMVMSGQVAGTLMAFGALALNTRALGAKELGLLFLVQATCELTAKVIAFQNWQTMIKFGAEALHASDGRLLTATWRFGFMLDLLAAAAASLVAASLFAFAPGLVGLDAETGRLGLIYAASLLLSASGTSIGAMRLLDRFGLVVATNVATSALLLLNAGGLYLMGAPLSAYLLTIPLIGGAASVFLILAANKRVGDTARGVGPSEASESSPFSRRGFFRFAIGVSATGTLSAFRQRGEIVVVGAILGPAAAALYGVAYRLAAVLARFAEAGRQSVYPEMGKLVAGGRFPEAAALAFRLCRLGLLVAAPGIVLIALFGDHALALLFGREFSAAYSNLILLSIGTAIYVVIFPLGPLIQVAFGSVRFFKLNLIAFCGFAAFAALGPLTFGQPGAGAGAVAFSTILASLALIQVRLRNPSTV